MTTSQLLKQIRMMQQGLPAFLEAIDQGKTDTQHQAQMVRRLVKNQMAIAQVLEPVLRAVLAREREGLADSIANTGKTKATKSFEDLFSPGFKDRHRKGGPG